MSKENMIQIQADVNAPLKNVWEMYTQPEHVMHWNHASDDWHCPNAENDLRVGGEFSYRMEAKDGSFGFDFSGTYNEVEQGKKIAYIMADNRKVEVTFGEMDERVSVVVSFEAENENPAEMQREGWQSILNNFKKYVEEN